VKRQSLKKEKASRDRLCLVKRAAILPAATDLQRQFPKSTFIRRSDRLERNFRGCGKPQRRPASGDLTSSGTNGIITVLRIVIPHYETKRMSACLMIRRCSAISLPPAFFRRAVDFVLI
jgi:hypothetical protein